MSCRSMPERCCPNRGRDRDDLVTVRVVGSDGRPIVNAMVSAYGAGFVQSATDIRGWRR